MAIEYDREIIASGYNLSKINNNFAKIEEALVDGISRTGEGPNQMEADLDMNSNDILNVKDLDVTGSISYQGSIIAPEEFFIDNLETSVQSAIEAASAADASADRAEDAAELAEELASTLFAPYNNVAAVVGASLTVGQSVKTKGYFSPEDGGAAEYDVVAPGPVVPIPPVGAPYVIIHTGQSNAVGYSGATGGVFPSNANVYMWLADTNGGAPYWVQNPNFAVNTYFVPIAATATYHQLGGGKSHAGLALAHRTQLATGRPVYLIHDGLGGRPVSEWVGTSSIRYASLKNNIVAGLAAIPGSPTSVQIGVWQQGEADAAMSSSDYQTALTTVYNQLQAEPFWTATTQFIAGRLNPANTSYANVNAGIDAFAAAEPTRRHVADTTGLEVEVDNVHFTGRALYELGYSRYWDALDGVGMPDVGSRILLTNNLIAQLKHSNVLKGEWFGCVGGLESSARLNALNRYAIAVRALPQYASVTITQNSYVTVKDPVLFGSGSVTSADLASYHIKLNGRIYVASGGLLEAHPERFALQFSGFETSVLELPFFRANWICNGVKIAGYIRGMVSGGNISRGKVTSVEVSGVCSGTNFYSLRAYQRTATDDQSALNGYALDILDTEDIAFYGGQLGIAAIPLRIRGNASTIHFERIHVHNGSASAARSETIVVWNESSGFNIRFDNCYFDNGYVVDHAGNASFNNCLHLFVNAWVSLTHPLMRIRVGADSARTYNVKNQRGTVGYYTTTYTSLKTLGGAGGTTSGGSYGDGGWRADVVRPTAVIPTPALGQTSTLINQYYQYDDGGLLPLRWTNYWQGNTTNWDWGQDTVRLTTPGRPTATPSIFFGETGFLGMRADSTQSDLVLGSSSALRIRVTNATGSLLPEADNSQQLGSAPRRFSTVYAGTGTINTSDRRHKQDIQEISDGVLDAWKDLRLVTYRWIDSVSKKGDEARTHSGVIAQEIKEAFEAKGLDALKYGVLCYDEWDGGNIWSVRETQVLFIEAAYQRRRADKIEARLAAIEEKLGNGTV